MERVAVCDVNAGRLAETADLPAIFVDSRRLGAFPAYRRAIAAFPESGAFAALSPDAESHVPMPRRHVRGFWQRRLAWGRPLHRFMREALVR